MFSRPIQTHGPSWNQWRNQRLQTTTRSSASPSVSEWTAVGSFICLPVAALGSLLLCVIISGTLIIQLEVPQYQFFGTDTNTEYFIKWIGSYEYQSEFSIYRHSCQLVLVYYKTNIRTSVSIDFTIWHNFLSNDWSIFIWNISMIIKTLLILS